MITEKVKLVELLPPATRTATANGSYVDLSQIGGENVMLILHVGAVTGTTPTLDVKLQDADDTAGTNVADVAGVAFAQKSAAGLFRLNVNKVGIRKAVRVVAAIGGTTPSFPCSVVAAVEASVLPVAAQS